MNPGGKERPHYRTSKTGKIFKAGTGPGSIKNTFGIDIDYIKHFARKTFGAKKYAPPKSKLMTTRKRKGF